MNPRTYARFIEAIQTHPDLDDPRLVFADALEQSGDPYGEFIRAQCELAKAEQWSARWAELSRFVGGMLIEHGDEWTRGLSGLPIPSLDWHRGFVHELALTVQDFVTHGEAIHHHAPLASKVTLIDGATRPAPLADSRQLAWVRSLHVPPILSNDDSDKFEHVSSEDDAHLDMEMRREDDVAEPNPNLPDIAHHVANSPFTARLEELRIVGHARDASVRSLAHSPHLLQLRSLSLDGCNLQRESIAALLASPLCRQLVRLSLRQVWSDSELFIRHADSLLQMEALSVGGAFDSVDRFATFLKRMQGGRLRMFYSSVADQHAFMSEQWALLIDLLPRSVKTLSLANRLRHGLDFVPIGAAIARLRPTELDLRGNNLRRGHLSDLAQHWRDYRCENLHLGGNQFSDLAIGLLARGGRCRRLRSIGLSGHENVQNLKALSNIDDFPALCRVVVSNMTITDRRIHELASRSAHAPIRSLKLRNVRLDVAAATALANSRIASDLVELDLSGTVLDGPIFQALVAENGFQGLARLDLSPSAADWNNTDFTEERLQISRPVADVGLLDALVQWNAPRLARLSLGGLFFGYAAAKQALASKFGKRVFFV